MKNISLHQILSRARARSECGVFCAGNRKLPAEGREIVYLTFHPHWKKVEFVFWSWGMALPHPSARRGFIPRVLLDHSSEIVSGKDPTQQYFQMGQLVPSGTGNMRLVGGLTNLWKPWVLEALDL
ncbi:MAG: hypothetical protein IJ705_08175 [Oscillospiraceae bacterium]|nr:hypothetical protein [Oscillospiraceae bacterium]